MQKNFVVGSGMYPYSLIDMYKRFPEKNYYGIRNIKQFFVVYQKRY